MDAYDTQRAIGPPRHGLPSACPCCSTASPASRMLVRPRENTCAFRVGRVRARLLQSDSGRYGREESRSINGSPRVRGDGYCSLVPPRGHHQSRDSPSPLTSGGRESDRGRSTRARAGPKTLTVCSTSTGFSETQTGQHGEKPTVRCQDELCSAVHTFVSGKRPLEYMRRLYANVLGCAKVRVFRVPVP
jgi:hypothetical protein